MADYTRGEVIEIVHKLRKADLQGVDLRGINLAGVILHQANLSGANLSGANLTGAKYNKHTVFPEGFDPDTAGMVLVESP